MSRNTANAVSCIQMLCGALILYLLDQWLRRRDVKDRSLVYLYASLLSWAAIQGAELLFAPGSNERNIVVYVLSPVSSILFTKAAFNLARVKEYFRANKDLKTWPRNVVLTVAALSVGSVVAVILMPSNKFVQMADATVSSLALFVLGSSLSYSFYRYGNPPLVCLTAGSILYKIAWQFVRATTDTPHGALSALNVASNIVLVMLFIALAMAWGLSDTSRLKFVSHRLNVYVIALFFDLRGSTQWCARVMAKNGPIDSVAEFMDNLLEWSLAKARSEANDAPDFVKFLGDGFLFVWEFAGENSLDEHTPSTLRLACRLSEEYAPWIRAERWDRKIGGVPDSVGVGVYTGNVIRIAFENGSRDYIGAPINHAAKMQNLARPNGGVVVPADVLDRLDTESVAADLCAKFTKSGQIRTADGQFVPIRATGDVEIRPVAARLL